MSGNGEYWDNARTTRPATATQRRYRQAQRNGASQQLPPYSIEAEQGAISCMLQVDNESAINDAEERAAGVDWFYDLRHQAIWQAILDLRNSGAKIDCITLMQWLKDRGLLEQVGGMQYLQGLPDVAPSAANAPHYLAILREKQLLREVIKAGEDAIAGAYGIEQGEKTNPEDLITRLERSIGRLSEESSTVQEIKIGQIVSNLMPDLEDYHRGRAQIHGLTTGLEYLDKVLCGLGGDNGNYIVVSGRPSTGKTSLAMQIADHAALSFVWWQPLFAERVEGLPPAPLRDEQGNPRFERKVGIPVGIFSYEMTKEALVKRMLFAHARADMQRWRTGFAEATDVQSLVMSSHAIADARIYIDDSPGTVESLRARARRMFRQHGIKCFIIDYLQLMYSLSAGHRRREDRVQELSEVSRVLRELAKELNIPFIVLAQMNRDYEKEPTRPPRLSDLKDCGAIEQDADVVTFLHSPRMKDKDKAQYDAAMEAAFPDGDWSKRPSRVNILIAKNRNGPTGKAELLFQKSCCVFHDWIAWLKSKGQKEFAQGESNKATESGAAPAGGPPEEAAQRQSDLGGYADEPPEEEF